MGRDRASFTYYDGEWRKWPNLFRCARGWRIIGEGLRSLRDCWVYTFNRVMNSSSHRLSNAKRFPRTPSEWERLWRNRLDVSAVNESINSHSFIFILGAVWQPWPLPVDDRGGENEQTSVRQIFLNYSHPRGDTHHCPLTMLAPSSSIYRLSPTNKNIFATQAWWSRGNLARWLNFLFIIYWNTPHMQALDGGEMSHCGESNCMWRELGVNKRLFS